MPVEGVKMPFSIFSDAVLMTNSALSQQALSRQAVRDHHCVSEVQTLWTCKWCWPERGALSCSRKFRRLWRSYNQKLFLVPNYFLCLKLISIFPFHFSLVTVLYTLCNWNAQSHPKTKVFKKKIQCSNVGGTLFQTHSDSFYIFLRISKPSGQRYLAW